MPDMVPRLNLEPLNPNSFQNLWLKACEEQSASLRDWGLTSRTIDHTSPALQTSFQGEPQPPPKTTIETGA